MIKKNRSSSEGAAQDLGKAFTCSADSGRSFRAQPHSGTEFLGLRHAIIKQTRCKGWYRKEIVEAGAEKSCVTQSCEELRTMSNSVSITRLPLDPELLGELIERLPNEVFEQLTHNWGRQSGTLASAGRKENRLLPELLRGNPSINGRDGLRSFRSKHCYSSSTENTSRIFEAKIGEATGDFCRR
jgi:hypothetical protein